MDSVIVESTSGADAAANRAAGLDRACEFAVESFRARIQHLEYMRNRSLVALALLSGAATLLAVGGVLERLQPVLWVPVMLFGLALIVSLPPLMSVGVPHPIALSDLYACAREKDSQVVTEVLLRDSALADQYGEKLARATAVYTDNGLRLAVIGTVSLVVPLVLPTLRVSVAVGIGVLLGLVSVALVELGRHVIGSHVPAADESGGQ